MFCYVFPWKNLIISYPSIYFYLFHILWNNKKYTNIEKKKKQTTVLSEGGEGNKILRKVYVHLSLSLKLKSCTENYCIRCLQFYSVCEQKKSLQKIIILYFLKHQNLGSCYFLRKKIYIVQSLIIEKKVVVRVDIFLKRH